MKKINLYYIVSIVTLVLMMFILYRTLQVRGWFDEPGAKSPAERMLQDYPGAYQLKLYSDKFSTSTVLIKHHGLAGDEDWLMINLDSIPIFNMKISDFEDDQILIEIYDIDSTGAPHRLEGCELLLSEDEAGNFRGSTIGDFCGLTEQSTEYLALDLLLSGPIVSLKIERHVLGQAESPTAQKYLLERIDSW